MEIPLIPLVWGLVALIDDDDAARVLALRWYADKRARTTYAHTTVDGATVYLHRFVFDAAPGTTVDHVNHDGLDCRKTNLRHATYTQQNGNQRKRTLPSSSRFKGVHLWKDRGEKYRWRAMVEARGIVRSVSCATEIEAANAYNRLALAAFGEFALLNDVPPAPEEDAHA